jgi:hypothetical protein
MPIIAHTPPPAHGPSKMIVSSSSPTTPAADFSAGFGRGRGVGRVEAVPSESGVKTARQVSHRTGFAAISGGTSRASPHCGQVAIMAGSVGEVMMAADPARGNGENGRRRESNGIPARNCEPPLTDPGPAPNFNLS